MRDLMDGVQKRGIGVSAADSSGMIGVPARGCGRMRSVKGEGRSRVGCCHVGLRLDLPGFRRSSRLFHLQLLLQRGGDFRDVIGKDGRGVGELVPGVEGVALNDYSDPSGSVILKRF